MNFDYVRKNRLKKIVRYDQLTYNFSRTHPKRNKKITTFWCQKLEFSKRLTPLVLLTIGHEWEKFACVAISSKWIFFFFFCKRESIFFLYRLNIFFVIHQNTMRQPNNKKNLYNIIQRFKYLINAKQFFYC